MDLSVEMSLIVCGGVARRETAKNKRIGIKTSMRREEKKARANDKLSHRYLKMQTSRECAELISLIKASQEMKVVEVKEATGLTREEFVYLMKENVPVVFRGYAAEWKCVKEWSKCNYLEQAAVAEARDLPHRKYRSFTAHVKEAGRVHLTDGESKARSVSMEEFILRADLDENVVGRYLLGIHEGGGKTSCPIYCPVQAHRDDKGGIPPLAQDLPQSIDILTWYSQYLGDVKGVSTPVPYDHQQFFLSKGYAFTDLHYDTYDNFYVATSGTRRWTLACPNASRWFLDASSGKLKSGSQIVPHKNVFPAGSPAQVYPFCMVDLYPGDVLFVPSCWWHLVESLPGVDGLSSAFNFFFSKPPDEVYSKFEHSLSVTEATVYAMQSECRVNITRGDAVTEFCQADAPRRIQQSLWDQLIRLATVHDITTDLHRLSDLLSSNSIFRFESKSGIRVEPFCRADPSLSKQPRLSDVSTVPDEEAEVETDPH